MDYSQHGEQALILQFFEGQPPGRFLDLGAYDGLTDSNTRALSDRGWHGVCVEACPATFVRLVENHRDNPKIECVNAAVMPRPGLVRLHDCMSPCTTARVDHHVHEHVRRQYWVTGITIPKLRESLNFHGAWDFVSLDIEGVDLDVLIAAGDWLLRGTQLVCVEDTIPGCPFDDRYYDELRAVLARLGFTRLIGRTHGPEKPANTLLARP
jgi:FkbM family methyltransferase